MAKKLSEYGSILTRSSSTVIPVIENGVNKNITSKNFNKKIIQFPDETKVLNPDTDFIVGSDNSDYPILLPLASANRGRVLTFICDDNVPLFVNVQIGDSILFSDGTFINPSIEVGTFMLQTQYLSRTFISLGTLWIEIYNSSITSSTVNN